MRFVRKNGNRRKHSVFVPLRKWSMLGKCEVKGTLDLWGAPTPCHTLRVHLQVYWRPQCCCGHSDSWVFRILGKSVKTQLTRCTYIMKSCKTILTQLLKQLKVVSRNRRLPGFCRMALSSGKGLGAWQCWLGLPSLLKRYGYHSLGSHLSSKTCKLLRHYELQPRFQEQKKGKRTEISWKR